MIKAPQPRGQDDAWTRRSARLTADIDRLVAALYNTRAKDPHLRHSNLEAYRIEIIRGFVLYIHLAIEDLLRAILFDFLAQRRRRSTRREIRKAVDNLRSADLIHWCGRLNLLSPQRYKALLELNKVRNACAHKWVLDIPRTIRVSPRRKRRVPAVLYEGNSLFAANTFVDRFCPRYGRIYLKLLSRVWRMEGRL